MPHASMPDGYKRYTLITDRAGLDTVAPALGETHPVALDTETTGVDPRPDRRLPLNCACYTVAGGADDTAKVVASLNHEGYWLAPLGNNSHPYKRDGSKAPQPGDYSQTNVGDETDTSPFPDAKLMGISIAAYIRNMGALIRALDSR